MKIKKIALLFAAFLALSTATAFADQKVKITTVPATAEIWVNGQKVASGTTTVNVPNNSSVQVEIRNFGYIHITRTYALNKVTRPPKNDLITLAKDPSIDASSNTDIANRDIDVKTDRPEDEAWRLVSQIVTGTFDVIEVTDRTTGYLRTAWALKRFDPGSSIRTRLIVKIGSTNPLVYKVKIVSEYAPAGTSPREDEKWTEWDRLPRAYLDVVPEIQSRLGR